MQIVSAVTLTPGLISTLQYEKPDSQDYKDVVREFVFECGRGENGDEATEEEENRALETAILEMSKEAGSQRPEALKFMFPKAYLDDAVNYHGKHAEGVDMRQFRNTLPFSKVARNGEVRYNRWLKFNMTISGQIL
jgi:hypothetical protein